MAKTPRTPKVFLGKLLHDAVTTVADYRRLLKTFHPLQQELSMDPLLEAIAHLEVAEDLHYYFEPEYADGAPIADVVAYAKERAEASFRQQITTSGSPQLIAAAKVQAYTVFAEAFRKRTEPFVVLTDK